jgi:membrane associated rhomboid family serine protease
MSLGYENAPLIQLISVFTILLGWFHGSSKILSLDLFKIGDGQLWRLLSSQMIFESTAESIVGLMLLYTFRQFERQMGTRKFGFFVFLSLLVSLFNLITFQILLLSVDIHFVPASGPYFLVYAMLAIFYCEFFE